MLNKSKDKKKHCGHTGVVVSDEEIVKIGLKKGREPLRLSLLMMPGVAALGIDPARLCLCP